METVIYDYDDANKEEFKTLLRDADALLTAYIPMNREMLDCAEKLRIVSLTSSGYNFVDLDYATKKGIAVAPIGEYCSEEVADHAMALLLALNRKIKKYMDLVENQKSGSVKKLESCTAYGVKPLAYLDWARLDVCSPPARKHLVSVWWPMTLICPEKLRKRRA